MADNWMEDDGWLTDAEKRRQPDPNRGQILPLRKTEDGVEFAWPQFMVDAYNAVTLPRDTIQGYKPTAEDTTNFALNVAGGGVGTSAALKPEADLGMFLGRKAKNADTKKLSQAMSLASQGVPREEIWTQTGWWQKPDGEWAFEVSDDGFNFDQEIIDILYNTPHEAHEYNTVVTNAPEKTIPHQMFDQYDDIPVDQVRLSLGEKAPYGGFMDSEKKVISASAPEEDALRSVALHEMQHGVQAAEDWKGKGSNPEFTAYTRHVFKSKAPKEWQEFNKIQDSMFEVMTSKEEVDYDLKHAQKMYRWARDNKLPELALKHSQTINELEDRWFKLDERYKTLHQEGMEKRKNPKVMEFEKELDNFEGMFGSTDFEMYGRNEGEAIANLTAARRDLTESERIAIPPWEMWGQEFSVGRHTKTLPKEGQTWTDEQLNNFLQDWLKNPKGSLEDFNRDLQEAMNGRE